MVKKRKLITVILCVTLVISCFGGLSLGKNSVDASTGSYKTMDDLIKILGGENSKGMAIDGESAFDYLSYVFMGWRTTGGDWQNNVIGDFIVDQLEDAGYQYAGAGQTGDFASNTNTIKSDVDRSNSSYTTDSAWVTYYGSSSNTWDPKFASLKIVSDKGSIDEGKFKALQKRIEFESYGFDPTSAIYRDHYDDKYNADNPIDMWKWITETSGGVYTDGYDKGFNERVNVANGKEAELNLRTHLATNSNFTNTDTSMGSTDTVDSADDVPGITGEAIYVGTINSTAAAGYNTSLYPTTASALAACEGKVILSDSSLSNTSTFAQRVNGVAVMSTNSLASYSIPKDENGNIISPFEKSARYAGGGNFQVNGKGQPIVNWQFSTDQKAALKELLIAAEDAGESVIIENKALGERYPMNSNKGQAVAVSEIKGASKPDERILICAHVQEPSANDNATGVGAQLELATKLKKMIDSGAIERPERTITFLWGDEMNLATLWMKDHPAEASNLVSVLDMDMVGENPQLTGGVMRIEKTPDPSAVYQYTLDELPWVTDPNNEGGPYYDRETFQIISNTNGAKGEFVRLPDSHTLWGAGSTSNLFNSGFFLNDLYMAASQSVINNHDNGFQVDVCPYEGGSDHSRFLANNIPALLTWHFTDYTYHTTVDTLAMSSAREMEDVDITTIASALQIANATEDNPEYVEDMLKMVYDAAIERFETEKINTENHRKYIKATGADFESELSQEINVLEDWGQWYKEAIKSVGSWLLDSKSNKFRVMESNYVAKIENKTSEAINYANTILQPDVTVTFDSAGGTNCDAITLIQGHKVGNLPTPVKSNYNFAGWYSDNTYKTQITADTIITEDMTIVARWVEKDNIAGAVVNAVKDQTYSGKDIKPDVTLKLNGKKLEKNKDYTVAYSKNRKVGKATIVLTGKGEYKGTKNIAFKIIPKNASKIKIKSAKKKINVNWKRTGGITKYQVSYKVKSAKKWTIKNVKASKKTFTIKNLKAGKKYQVKVRSYKTVNGVKYYSKWSKTKTVTVKK